MTDSASSDAAPSAVLMDPAVVSEFLKEAVENYLECRRTVAAVDTPLFSARTWGLLFGRIDGDAMRVESIRFAANVRETSEVALAEFDEVIVPCFGVVYANKARGFWCDPAELLRLTREAEAEGMELLGSVHSHPDWHRIGPPHERWQRVSEQPTEMDEYVFRNTGWPVNMICYLESRGSEVVHTFAAWSPPSFDDPASRAAALPIRFSIATI